MSIYINVSGDRYSIKSVRKRKLGFGMGFSGSGSGGGRVASSTDVALNGPANNDVLTYDSTSSKWKNATASGGGGPITIANLPAGSVVYARYNTSTSTWPARPTSRNDIMVHWVGGGDSNPPSGALNGIDLWDWIGS